MRDISLSSSFSSLFLSLSLALSFSVVVFLSPLLQFSLYFLVSPTFSHPFLPTLYIYLLILRNSTILRSLVKSLLCADNIVSSNLFRNAVLIPNFDYIPEHFYKRVADKREPYRNYYCFVVY